MEKELKENTVVKQIFSDNLNRLMKEHGVSQRKLATLTGISVASINNYINKVSEPSIYFLFKLKFLYNISIDSFLSENLSVIEGIDSKVTFAADKFVPSVSNYKNFIGNYIVYYYDSSSYTGKAINSTKDSLKYGVISVYEKENLSGRELPANEQFKAVSTFIKTREDAEMLKRDLDSPLVNTNQAILNAHAKAGNNYFGNIELTRAQGFILLSSPTYDDKTLIIFNNPPIKKPYIGGIGTVNSVSRGREQTPCVQLIMMSRYILNIPDGEIFNMLALGIGNVDVRDETEQLLKLFKNLYLSNAASEAGMLEEFQKFKIIQNSLELLVQNYIDANMFRYAKISNFDDDNYYRLIKSEASNV